MVTLNELLLFKSSVTVIIVLFGTIKTSILFNFMILEEIRHYVKRISLNLWPHIALKCLFINYFINHYKIYVHIFFYKYSMVLATGSIQCCMVFS